MRVVRVLPGFELASALAVSAAPRARRDVVHGDAKATGGAGVSAPSLRESDAGSGRAVYVTGAYPVVRV